MPQDPIAAFLAGAPARRVPTGYPSTIPAFSDEPITHHEGVDAAVAGPARRSSVADDLAGTMFADPVRNFLLTRPIEHSPRARAFESFVDRVFQAPKSLTDYARENARWLTEPSLEDSPARAAAKGFVAGAGEGGAGMGSPFNIAATLAPALRGPGAVASLLRAARLGGDAFLTGMSAAQTKDAYDRGDVPETALGAGMTLAGAAGILGGVRDSAAAVGEHARAQEIADRLNRPPREEFENGNHRMPPLGDDYYRPEDQFEPNPGFDVRNPRPWWEKPTTVVTPQPNGPQLREGTFAGELPPAGGTRGNFEMGPSPSRPPGPMDLPDAELRRRFTDAVFAGDPAAADLAAELERRGNVLQRRLPPGRPTFDMGPAPEPPPPPTRPPGPMDLSDVDLRNRFTQAVFAGDPAADALAAEIARRGLQMQRLLPAQGSSTGAIPLPPAAPEFQPPSMPPARPVPYGKQVEWQHPRDPVADFFRNGPPEPPSEPPASATPPPRPSGPPAAPAAPAAAAPSQEDLVAQALGFPDAAAMRARGNELAPARIPPKPKPAPPPEPPALEAAKPEPPPAPPAPPVAAEPAPVGVEAPPSPPVRPALDPESEALWQAVLADAREQGYAGPESDLRAAFDEHVQSGRSLIDSMNEIAQEYAPSALMKEIRRLGGLRPFDRDMVTKRQMRGDLASIVESFASPSTHGHRGAASIFRNNGLALDDLLQQLGQDPRWRNLDDRQLLEELDRTARKLNEDGYEVPDLSAAVRAAGLRMGEPWWDTAFDPAVLERPADPLVDLLDTGESQPRLPGDVGAVRESEVPTPREEAPFSLTPQTSTAPDALQTLLGDAETRPADAADRILAYLNEADARGENVGRLADALQRGEKWQQDPAIHEDLLGLFRKAGVEPPFHLTDPDAFHQWLLDVKGAIEQGRTPETPAQPETPPTAQPPAAPAVRPNIKDFLVRQLGYAPEEVDALGPERAMEIGNKVRMHPDGVRAGIEAYRKPKPPAPPSDPSPRPNLGEDSLRVPADELATLLGIQQRRTALQRSRVPAEDVDVPRGTETSGAPAPRTAAQRHAAGERLTEKERQELNLPEPAKPERKALTQSEVALAKSKMTEDARRRAKLLENPTPENLDEYARLLGEAADRQAEREFKGGTAKEGSLRTNERTGEYLASGLGGLQELYDKNPALFWLAMRTAGGALVGAIVGEQQGEDPLAWALAGAGAGAALGPVSRILRAKAPGVFKALMETLPPRLGGEEGAAPGTQVVRRPRDLSKDISGLEQRVYGQPHRTVPDVWERISPALDDLAAAEREQPSTTPQMFQSTRNMYLREVLADIDAAARDAKASGLHRRAKYLQAMADELRGTPTVLERLVSDLTSGKVTPKQTRQTLHRIESSVYVSLLGAALDTALVNRTQVLLAYPQIGAAGVLEGVKRARTEEGQAEAAFLNLDKPGDEPTGPMARVPNRTLRKIADGLLSPLKASDQRNRKEVYLGAMYTARKQGLPPAAAHEFAMEITAQTQGTPGELGNNPFHRHLGPLRMFTKYPQIWGQWLVDAATHPDPGVRRRLVGYFLGFGAVGAVTGINVMNLLFPRLIPSSAAYKAAKDVVSHVPGLNALTGPADHTIAEDIDPRRGGKIIRYPVKAAKEIGDFARSGFGTHESRNATGQPTGEHSAWEGFLSLLGLESNRQATDRADTNAAYDWIAENTRKRNTASRLSRQDLARAIEEGDREAITTASRSLSRDQLRSFYQQMQRDRYQRMLARVPKADRAEFERQPFARRLRGGK